MPPAISDKQKGVTPVAKKEWSVNPGGKRHPQLMVRVVSLMWSTRLEADGEPI